MNERRKSHSSRHSIAIVIIVVRATIAGRDACVYLSVGRRMKQKKKGRKWNKLLGYGQGELDLSFVGISNMCTYSFVRHVF